MDFRLLGPFEVWEHGYPLPLGARRQRAILALLALHPREVLSTDRIVEEIWGEDAPPSAVRTVHAYISRLRSCLREGSDADARSAVIVSREPGYLLQIDPDQIDAARFENGVLQAAALMLDGDPRKANEVLRAVLELWRGAALADFMYESFAAIESERLAERRLDAIELRIETDLGLLRHNQVVSELEGLVAIHPVREHFWSQLMVALYRSGRQSDALAVYGRVRQMLIEERGIEPGPELRRLERLVLEQSPELAWKPPLIDSESPAPTAGRGGGTGRRPHTVQSTMAEPGHRSASFRQSGGALRDARSPVARQLARSIPPPRRGPGESGVRKEPVAHGIRSEGR